MLEKNGFCSGRDITKIPQFLKEDHDEEQGKTNIDAGATWAVPCAVRGKTPLPCGLRFRDTTLSGSRKTSVTSGDEDSVP